MAADSEHLTSSQRARFRRAYREASASSNRSAEVSATYQRFEALYGVSRDALRRIIEAQQPHTRGPSSEAAPRPEPQRRKEKPVPKWVKRIIETYGPEYRPTCCPKCYRNFRDYFIPQHRLADGYICKGSAKRGVPKYPLPGQEKPKTEKRYDDRTPSSSVHAYSGGLPGGGRRR